MKKFITKLIVTLLQTIFIIYSIPEWALDYLINLIQGTKEASKISMLKQTVKFAINTLKSGKNLTLKKIIRLETDDDYCQVQKVYEYKIAKP